MGTPRVSHHPPFEQRQPIPEEEAILTMKKRLVWTLFSILLIGAFAASACGPSAPAATPTPESMTIALWHQEGEAENAAQYVQSLADAYSAMHPNVSFELTNKETEVLREDFQTAALAGSAPDLLWTVNDHAGPFTAADLIQPVDDLFDLSQYVDSGLAAVVLDGKTWGVPISNGNHLMLYYNKTLIDFSAGRHRCHDRHGAGADRQGHHALGLQPDRALLAGPVVGRFRRLGVRR